MITHELDAPWRLAVRMPMVRLAAPWLLGVVLGRGSDPRVLPWLLTLVGLGLFLRRPAGWSVVWFAAGWAITLVGGGTVILSRHPEIALDRPLQVTGRVAGCWVESEMGWTAPLRVEEVEQNGRALRLRGMLRLGLPEFPEQSPRCGGTVRVRGYLVGPRYYYNEPRVAVGGDALFVKSLGLYELLERPGWWHRGLGWVRHRVSPPGWRAGASSGERLAHALALGETNAIDPHWREGLRRVGLSHVLAVSGLHLGIVAAWMALLSFRWRRGWRLLATLTALVSYGGLVGPQPSVLRAGVMGAIVLSALLVRRPPVAINALGLGVSLLVLIDPGLILRLGFQLSVAATTGIILLAPGIHRNLRELGSWIGALATRTWSWDFQSWNNTGPRGLENSRGLWGLDLLSKGVAVTLAAQIATIPWTLGLFHWGSVPAALFNLAAVPWVGLTLALSLLWVGLETLLPGTGGSLLGWLLDFLAYPCEALAGVGASWWMGQAVVLEPRCLTVSMVALVLWSLRFSTRAWSHLLLLAAVGAFWVGSPPMPSTGSEIEDGAGRVRLSVLDVGQGDAILLQDGTGSILIDGGGWTGPGLGTRVLAPALRRLGVKRLSLAIISHPDRDHCGGVLDLLRVLPVDEVLTETFEPVDNSCLQELSALSVRRRTVVAGDVFLVGGWSFEVLGPLVPEGRPMKDHNSRSLVLRAQARGRCILLTGDIDQETERELRSRWGDDALHCDLLKVAHHGSKSSTSPGWLYANRPRIALISAGRANRYGHPTPEVLQRLSDRDIRLFRTDRDGQISIEWNRRLGWRIDLAVDGVPTTIPP